MPQFGRAQFVEILSVARIKTDQEEPAVVLTVRPQPDRSWQPHNLGLTWSQAERLRDDLETLLRGSATFLLIAALALATTLPRNEDQAIPWSMTTHEF